MTFFAKLKGRQRKTKSLVCVGLDTDIDKIPKHLLQSKDPVFAFNKAIIDNTKGSASTYKLNIAFYEAMGLEGLASMKKTVDYLHSMKIPVIVDAKRNDIGNTAEAYAKAIFDYFEFDAMTVNPYMGGDSVGPFLKYKDKGVIILARTSNPGGADFQNLDCEGMPLYQRVVEKAKEWDQNKNIALVVGATVPEELKIIRNIVPEMTFLVPGIGPQGGDIEKTVTNGIRKDGLGLIMVSARGIIYASDGDDFAEAAQKVTIELRDEINKYRNA